MTKQQQQELLKIISTHVNRPVDSIQATDRFHEDYGTDSMDVMQLSSHINQHFHVAINEEDLAPIQTVNELIDCVSNAIAQSPKK